MCHSRHVVDSRYCPRENLDILIDTLLRAWATHGVGKSSLLRLLVNSCVDTARESAIQQFDNYLAAEANPEAPHRLRVRASARFSNRRPAHAPATKRRELAGRTSSISHP